MVVRARRHVGARRAADRGDDAVVEDQRLILARRRAGAVDHARVGQRDERRIDRHIGADGGESVGRCCATSGRAEHGEGERSRRSAIESMSRQSIESYRDPASGAGQFSDDRHEGGWRDRMDRASSSGNAGRPALVIHPDCRNRLFTGGIRGLKRAPSARFGFRIPRASLATLTAISLPSAAR